MAVLVTGGTGVVGLNILERLLSEGREVVSVSVTSIPERALKAFGSLPGRLHLYTADTTDGEAWKAVEGNHTIESLIHCAAITPNADRERDDFRHILEVNVLATLHALEAASRCQVRRMLYCSSGAVYGANSYGHDALAETVCPMPQTLYAVTKYASEGIVLRYAELRKLDVVVARLGAVFGRWEHDTGVRDMLSAPMQTTDIAATGGEAVLPREGMRDWIYGPDVATAVVGLLDLPKPRWNVYNVGPGMSWSVVQWCDLLLARYPTFRHRLADDAAGANVNFHAERDRSPMSIARIRADLGFEARFGLEQALTDYLDWRDTAAVDA
jgi:nucleoside-diphosphate-sugar epimerase